MPAVASGGTLGRARGKWGERGDAMRRDRLCEAARALDMSLILSAYSSWTSYEGAFDSRSTARLPPPAAAARRNKHETNESTAASPRPSSLGLRAALCPMGLRAAIRCSGPAPAAASADEIGMAGRCWTMPPT